MIENEQEFRDWCQYTLNDNTINSYVSWLNTVSNIIGNPISSATLSSDQHVADATALLRNNITYNPGTIQNMLSAMRKYVAMIRSTDVASAPVLLQRVKYDDLNARQKESYNFQKVAALLADYGFNCMKLADDWHGADFLAYHYSGDKTLKVQLKARISINKKYENKDLFLAFPCEDDWYLVAHDQLVNLVSQHTNWLNTESWISKGSYTAKNPSSSLLQALSRFKL